MKIVVTGALGHIGSKLIRRLGDDWNHPQITLIDNFYCRRYCSLFNLPANADFTFIEGDILAVPLENIFHNADAVIHLAAITDATSSFDKKQLVEDVNFTGTQKVARACIETATPLIFPSTTSVYGTNDNVVDENCTVDDLKPQSPYAEFKLKAEQLLLELSREQGLQVVIFRFGTIFGTSPGMRFHTAVNKFCWQAVMGQELTVWKTALNQMRPYLDIDDAINAMVYFIKHNIFSNEIFNVVTCNRTVQDIIDTIELYKKDPAIKYVDTRIMNQLSYRVLAEKITKRGLVFKGNLKEKIRETIKLISL